MGQHADMLRSFYAELLGWRFRMVPPMQHYAIVERKEGAQGIPGAVGQTG
ncbi:MAG: hypothetical protein JRE70_18780, partial [Deltaproteobacteria bacterium]|nr:hypothetical protein [Deltaproteobacteria bacterium]